MRTTFIKNGLDEEEFSIHSYPWQNLLDVVVWKIEQAKKVEFSIEHSLNYSLIVDLAGVVEGFTNHFLDIILEERTTTSYTEEQLDELIENNDKLEEENDFLIRLTDYVGEKMQKSTWIGYNELFQVIIGKKINNIIETQNWKCINSLFLYRNMIIHGKEQMIEYKRLSADNEYKISAGNKYRNVYAYLSEQNLIDAGQTGYVEIMSRRIIRHYYENVILFMESIVQSIDDNSERSKIIKIFSMDKNLRDLLPKIMLKSQPETWYEDNIKP